MRPKPPFLSLYASALEKMAAFIREQSPAWIIGVDRKGPKLGELCSEFGLDLFPKNVPVISHNALRYIPKQAFDGKTVVIVDDSVVWGSTLLDVIEDPKLASSHVVPTVIAISRSYNRGKLRSYELKGFESLSSSEMMNFSVLLVDAFRSLVKPFNTIHPIIELKTSNATRVSFEGLLHRLTGAGSLVCDITLPTQRERSANVVVTASRTPVDLPSAEAALSCDPKARLFHDFEKQLLLLEPLVLFRTKSQSLTDESAFRFNESAYLFYSEVCNAVKPDGGSKASLGALYTAQLHITELLYGLRLLDWLKQVGLEFTEHNVSLTNAGLLFGPDLTRHLGTLAKSNFSTKKATGRTVNRVESQSALCESQYAVSKPFLLEHLNAGTSFANNVATTLISLRPLDDNTRTTNEHVRDRLSFGYSFSDLSQIFRLHGIKHSSWELSTSLDYLIDSGVAVPITKVSSDDVERIFRFGETREQIAKLKHFVRIGVEKLLACTTQDRKHDVRTLGKVFTDKALAFAVRAGSRAGVLTADEMAVKIENARYGGVLEIDGDLIRGRVLPWALSERILVEEPEGLSLSAKFDERHPRTELPLSGVQEVFIANCMEWFVNASGVFKDSSNRYRIALAITTCNSAANTIDAIKTEIQLWSTDHGPNARSCWHKFMDILDRKKVKGAETVIAGLCKSLDQACAQGPADVMNQAALKLEVFRSLTGIRDSLRSQYSDNVSPVYRCYVDGLLDPDANDAELRKLNVLELIGKFCQSWTTILRQVGDVIHREARKEDFAVDGLHDAVSKANALAEQLSSVPHYRISVRIPLPPSSDSEVSLDEYWPQLAGSLDDCLQDVRDLLNVTVFARDAHRSEPIEKDITALCFDVIGSARTGYDFVTVDKNLDISLRLQRFLRERVGINDFRITTDDANTILIRNLSHVSTVLSFLMDCFEGKGLIARVGLHYTGNGGQRLLQNETLKVSGGQPYALASRLRDFKKDEYRDGRSHVFVSGVTRQALLNHDFLETHFLSANDGHPFKPHGEGLPPLEVYEWIGGAMGSVAHV